MERIDNEKIITLLKEYYKGNKEVLFYIIEYNLYLILPLAKELDCKYKIPVEKLYISIIEEFINAVNNYDLEKSTTFENYVKMYIKLRFTERYMTTNYQYRIKK
ncbi:MAG: hypothetical protein IJ134_03235 [Bacilli bacterium]|nr:hypothetical protein [Bacilli bacterium]